MIFFINEEAESCKPVTSKIVTASQNENKVEGNTHYSIYVPYGVWIKGSATSSLVHLEIANGSGYHNPLAQPKYMGPGLTQFHPTRTLHNPGWKLGSRTRSKTSFFFQKIKNLNLLCNPWTTQPNWAHNTGHGLTQVRSAPANPSELINQPEPVLGADAPTQPGKTHPGLARWPPHP